MAPMQLITKGKKPLTFCRRHGLHKGVRCQACIAATRARIAELKADAAAYFSRVRATS